MSRGNYYYARGWVGHGGGGFGSGEGARLSDFGNSMATSLLFLVMGVLLQAFSAFADVSWLSSTLPMFSFALGLIGVISMFSIPEEGIWYVGGWTFVSFLLFGYNLIGTGEFLTDLIPAGMVVAVVILSILDSAGVFDSLGRSYEM
jgi:hypothetical protein